MRQKKSKMDDIMHKGTVFFLFVAIFLPLSAHAETVLRVGENISVDADQTVEGDYYVSVGPLGDTTMSGNVTEDMYAFGGTVTANGSIGGDLTLVGGTSQLHATVTDDVRVVAAEVTVGDHVGGDLFVIAGKLVVLSTATIDGDILFFGGDAEINGVVGGSVLGTSERLRIDARVGEDVDVKTVALTLGEKAVITGDVSYESPAALTRAQNATIEGEVTKHAVHEDPKEQDVRNALIPVFVSLFAALTLFLLFKKELQMLVQHVHMHPLQSGAIGFAVVLLAPVLSILLIVTVLGMLVGIVGLAGSVLMYALGYALSGVILGSYLSRLFTKKITVSLVWIIVGTIVCHVLFFIPVLGLPLFILLLLFSVGGVAHYFYKLLS